MTKELTRIISIFQLACVKFTGEIRSSFVRDGVIGALLIHLYNKILLVELFQPAFYRPMGDRDPLSMEIDLKPTWGKSDVVLSEKLQNRVVVPSHPGNTRAHAPQFRPPINSTI